jgi:hypothetical protein
MVAGQRIHRHRGHASRLGAGDQGAHQRRAHPVLVALMAWGDQYAVGPEGPQVLLRHSGDGRKRVCDPARTWWTSGSSRGVVMAGP